jgi:hypothetical protein
MKRPITVNSYDLSEDELWQIIPDKIYKYTRISKTLKECLKNNQLWFASPNTLNDPFDCKAHINYGSNEDECLKNYEKLFSKIPKSIKAALNKLAKEPHGFNIISSVGIALALEKMFGVSCFTENYNNTLMWAHYADSHKGIIMEFKKEKSGLLLPYLLPVNYFKNYPVINVSDYPKEQNMAVWLQCLCAKGKDWKFENEWRVVRSPGNKKYAFNKTELSGIIFGLNTPDKKKRGIYDLIQKAGYKDVSFKQAEFDRNSFVVHYRDYNRFEK